MLRLFLIILFLLVVFSSILHLGTRSSVLVCIEVELVRVLHVLDHLLLEQERVDGCHAHGCALVRRVELLLLLLLLKRCEHLGLGLSLRLMGQQAVRLVASRIFFLLALFLVSTSLLKFFLFLFTIFLLLFLN